MSSKRALNRVPEYRHSTGVRCACEREKPHLKLGFILILKCVGARESMGQNPNSKSKNTKSENNGQFGRIFRYRRQALLLCVALPALAAGSAHAQQKPSDLPPVQVDAPKERAKPKQAATTPSTARRSATRTTRSPKPNANTQTAA